jgi:hypothetical protein
LLFNILLTESPITLIQSLASYKEARAIVGSELYFRNKYLNVPQKNTNVHNAVIILMRSMSIIYLASLTTKFQSQDVTEKSRLEVGASKDPSEFRERLGYSYFGLHLLRMRDAVLTPRKDEVGKDDNTQKRLYRPDSNCHLPPGVSDIRN